MNDLNGIRSPLMLPQPGPMRTGVFSVPGKSVNRLTMSLASTCQHFPNFFELFGEISTCRRCHGNSAQFKLIAIANGRFDAEIGMQLSDVRGKLAIVFS